MSKKFNDELEKWMSNTETITLSERDFKKLVDAIENPPEPNENLKRLMKKHQDLNT